MAEKAYLAIDMGASSGRHLIGRFDGRRLRLEEVHRFENGPVDLGGRLYWDLPGLWSRVRQGLTAAAGRRGRRCDRERGRRYLGRRFRPAGPQRRTAGQSLSLSRQPHQRHARTGLLDRPPRRDFPSHGLAVHAVQHALSTPGDEAGQVAAAGRCRDDLADARPHALAADRREVQRNDRGQHLAILQSREVRLGHRVAAEVRPADAHPRPDRPAGHEDRAAPRRPGGRNRSAGPGRAAGHPRHGQRRDGRPRRQQARASGPTGAISAWAPGP